MIRPIVLCVALLVQVPVAALAHNSLVDVTVDFELDPAQCAPGVGTFRGYHTGEITAIGLDDRKATWSLHGGIGSCAMFGANNPTSESHVFGIVESTPYLATSTQFDMICSTISAKQWFGRTQAEGPWAFNPSNHSFEETGCQSFQCSDP